MKERTFQIKYSINNDRKEYYIHYDGPDDYSLIRESALYEIKKHLNRKVSGKIKIEEINEI